MDLALLFKALSDETRLRILKLLEHGELCVCDIVAALQMSQPKVSFHLAALKEAGLIRDRREGKWIHYSITDSDMFRRFLMMAVFEKMDPGVSGQDRGRLEEFLITKQQRVTNNEVEEAPCAKCS